MINNKIASQQQHHERSTHSQSIKLIYISNTHRNIFVGSSTFSNKKKLLFSVYHLIAKLK